MLLKTWQNTLMIWSINTEGYLVDISPCTSILSTCLLVTVIFDMKIFLLVFGRVFFFVIAITTFLCYWCLSFSGHCLFLWLFRFLWGSIHHHFQLHWVPLRVQCVWLFALRYHLGGTMDCPFFSKMKSKFPLTSFPITRWALFPFFSTFVLQCSLRFRLSLSGGLSEFRTLLFSCWVFEFPTKKKFVKFSFRFHVRIRRNWVVERLKVRKDAGKQEQDKVSNWYVCGRVKVVLIATSAPANIRSWQKTYPRWWLQSF